MKWGIVGSRGFDDFGFMCEKLEAEVKRYGYPEAVVSGGANGADYLAEQWAALNKIRVIIHHPDWYMDGKAAGVIRNKLIVRDADHIYAFINDEMTPGTRSTVSLAREARKPIRTFSRFAWGE